MIKEVTVFSPGDSRSLTCWSNVPYLFTESLEKKGIKVNRVNIYSNKYIRKTVWKYLFAPIVRFIYKEHAYTYDQTSLNRWLTKLKIEKAQRKFKNSDLNILISYDYLPKDSSVPNVLFCDWTFEYLLKRLRREPCNWEKKEIESQKRIIEKADFVVSLFPDVTEYMKNRYENKRIYYLGQNVINNVYGHSIEKDQIIKAKCNSQILLFIGGLGYLGGAKMLISSFQSLKCQYPELELHIVGLSGSHFKFLPKDVYCYGYLDKSKDNDRNHYYELLKKAKIFVNPTPVWGGYSATVEAMYFYTPVVVSNYSSFVETFGRDISFGSYIEENKIEVLSRLLSALLELDENAYYTKCINAHEVVKSFTWDSFTDKFLEVVSRLDLDDINRS